jgi:hypothetical protein
MKKPYMVFIVQAHDGETPDMRLTNVTTLELIDTTYKSAEERAKKIVNRKHYRLSMVIEKYDHS